MFKSQIIFILLCLILGCATTNKNKTTENSIHQAGGTYATVTIERDGKEINTRILQPEEQIACFNRRLEKLKQVNEQYVHFSKNLRNLDLDNAVKNNLAICAFEFLANEDFDYNFIGAFFHEGIHFLGTVGLAEKTNKSIYEQAEAKGYYEYYEPFENKTISVEYYSRLPEAKAIIPKHSSEVSLKYERYIEKTDNNIMVLLDEWNTHLCQVKIELDMIKQGNIECKNTGSNDVGNGLVEFSYFSILYIKNLKKYNNDIYVKFNSLKNIELWIKHLEEGTNSIIYDIVKFVCLYKKEPFDYFYKKLIH